MPVCIAFHVKMRVCLPFGFGAVFGERVFGGDVGVRAAEPAFLGFGVKQVVELARIRVFDGDFGTDGVAAQAQAYRVLADGRQAGIGAAQVGRHGCRPFRAARHCAHIEFRHGYGKAFVVQIEVVAVGMFQLFGCIHVAADRTACNQQGGCAADKGFVCHVVSFG